MAPTTQTIAVIPNISPYCIANAVLYFVASPVSFSARLLALGLGSDCRIWLNR